MSMREERLLAMAHSVLAQKVEEVQDPRLTARVEYKPADQFDDGLIGFILVLPVSADKQVASRPAVQVRDASRAVLGEAFDDGLSVIRDEIEKVDA